ncbi:TIR domain-containing protein [Lentzea flava]|uniref:TIR domain-containing protein n=1 Tax=Lentzea flava TaxID=103732 RepID=A0ABQ2VCT3_9PSEU|nr:toll/interleukin-1 receptor domain-containing protein [Lentzea flava]MCP2204624.1 TIR domain-containing protein [Lentzea flava]GGU79732.1 hypothetical protein GCM10010178_83250 [Lentzea flava]
MRRRKGALWDVFISHSTKGFEGGLAHQLLTRLITDLPPRAIRVWADKKKLRQGDAWRKDIADAINKSHVGIILLDKRALGRPWIYKEANLMEGQPKERHYRIITVLIGLTRQDVRDHGNEVFVELVENKQHSVVENQPGVEAFLAELLDLMSSVELGLLRADEMRLVQMVAEHLPEDLDEIIDLTTWFVEEPHPPPLLAREVLAHLLLKAKLEPCVRQMFVDAKDYFLGKQNPAALKRLVRLIAPSWIPLEDAAPIVPPAGASRRVGVLGTIADASARGAITCETGKALVRRATHWDEHTCDVWEFGQIPTGAERSQELSTDLDEQLDYWARELDRTKYIVLEAGRDESDRLDGVRHVHNQWPNVVVVLVIGPTVDPEKEQFDSELGTPTYYRTRLPRADEARANQVIREICWHLDIKHQGESA